MMRFVLIFFFFVTAISANPAFDIAEEQNSPRIPAQISDFYRDFNFVCSFSTQSERDRLSKYINKESPPERMQSKRLTKIFHLLEKLFDQVYFYDTKMIVKPYPRVAGRLNNFHSVFYEIKNIGLFNGKTVIEVVVYSLEPNVVLRFISQYEENMGNESELPSEEERKRMAQSGRFQSKEFHKWFQHNGKWKREEARFVLLKNIR